MCSVDWKGVWVTMAWYSPWNLNPLRSLREVDDYGVARRARRRVKLMILVIFLCFLCENWRFFGWTYSINGGFNGKIICKMFFLGTPLSRLIKLWKIMELGPLICQLTTVYLGFSWDHAGTDVRWIWHFWFSTMTGWWWLEPWNFMIFHNIWDIMVFIMG